MRLTTKGRYAVTAMLDLALHQDKGPVRLANISDRQGISLSYLEQLFAQLRRGNLIRSVRGPGGGYTLGRTAAGITVAEVIAAVNEDTDATRCGGSATCHEGRTCLTHYLWVDLSDQIHAFLDAITLGDLIQRRDIQAVSREQQTRAQNEAENPNQIAANNV